MPPDASADNQPPLLRPRRGWAVAETALIFLVLFIQGAWPAPEANEAHYLSKARHFWDPAWCAHDFFCNTADAHEVFYLTFGWLSLGLPLPALAWCGRLLTWGLLAAAWQRLSSALVPAPLYSVLSAALLVTFSSHFQMSGEWLIGGVEAKGFAYTLVLLGLAALVNNHWTCMLLCFGLATSFHVIVGGWAIVAAGVAWLAARQRPAIRELAPGLVVCVLLALPGLAPALALNWNADADTVREANRIYVVERLSHHLVPQQFGFAMVRHLALVGALVVCVWLAPNDAPHRRLRGFVAGAVGLAVVGIVIGIVIPSGSPLSNALLRYYWFRLSDVMVPLGVALLGTSWIFRLALTRPPLHAAMLTAALALVTAQMGETLWLRHTQLQLSEEAGVRLAAWREICQWAADETPTDAVFLVPRDSLTFRWYAGRAEVVTYKDIPQDAAGVVEWWRRLQTVYPVVSAGEARWHESLVEQGAERLRALGAQFGADYVVTSATPALALERVGPLNSSYAVYKLAPAHPQPPPHP